MRYTLFGRSGLRVSEICLGAMRFGTEPDRGIDKATARQVFDAFADAGGNFVDTANVYNRGDSERTIGEFIRSDRHHFVLASKYSPGNPGEDVVQAGNSRKNMNRAVELSLKRTGCEFLDILYLHQWDFTTPSEEIMRGLDDLVRAGKVNYVAVSNAPAWIIARANLMADMMGWSPFIGMQLPYHLLERTSEREMFPMAQALGLGITSWSPLAQGILAGAHGEADTHTARKAMITPRERAVSSLVVKLAGQIGAKPAQVALAWIRQKAPLDVIPVVGADNAAQITDNIASLGLVLDEAVMAELNAATAVELGYPYAHLAMPAFVNMATSHQPERLRMPDRPRY
jgi:aryl-alcohol dehydrogenase-like predicted oxidoreductase